MNDYNDERQDNIVTKPKRARDIPLYIRVSQAEHDLIQERMTEAGTTNLTAFVRKMALNGYVLHVDLSPVKELVSLQRRCSNNLNQVAKRANETRNIYEADIEDLRRQYDTLWEAADKILKGLAKIIKPIRS